MTLGIQVAIEELTRLFAAFHQAVHVDRDVEAAVATFAEDGALLNLPLGTGATGADDLRRYLAEDVVGHLPPDLEYRRVTRTADQRRLVEETDVAFTHDRELPWLLPGVPPTGGAVEVRAVVIVAARHRSRHGVTTTTLASHRTLWDHAGLLTQLGLDLAAVRSPAAAPA